MQHSQQIPAQTGSSLAASSQAFTQTMTARCEKHTVDRLQSPTYKVCTAARGSPRRPSELHRVTCARGHSRVCCARRTTNTFEVAAGSTQWRTTSNSTPDHFPCRHAPFAVPALSTTRISQSNVPHNVGCSHRYMLVQPSEQRADAAGAWLAQHDFFQLRVSQLAT